MKGEYGCFYYTVLSTFLYIYMSFQIRESESVGQCNTQASRPWGREPGARDSDTRGGGSCCPREQASFRGPVAAPLPQALPSCQALSTLRPQSRGEKQTLSQTDSLMTQREVWEFFSIKWSKLANCLIGLCQEKALVTGKANILLLEPGVSALTGQMPQFRSTPRQSSTY